VLKEVGQILIKLSRDTDIVARKGGEEFTVLLMDCGVSKALKVAERIRKTIEENIFISEQNEEIRITISIGVSSFPDTIADEEKLTEQADIALYRAKRSGRNKVCLAP
jgi:diguanylate cyclase